MAKSKIDLSAAEADESGSWEPGRQLSQYTLIAKLATGGMGEVWLARVQGPKGFEKLAAVKRISGELSNTPEFIEMFADEARLAAQLSHPNIVQTYEFDEIDGIYYLVMEYLSGENVARVLRAAERRNIRMPMQLAVSIVADAASALEYAHNKTAVDGTPLGIVHRDMSPHNIFLTYDGVVKVVDFGVAKAGMRTTVTLAGLMKGKAAYMAPEQARPGSIDGRADQFSLAIVLFELLTYQRLISPEDSEARLYRLLSAVEILPTALERNPEVPQELSDIVSRALQNDRDARFPSMAAFSRALREWLARAPPLSDNALSQYMQSLFKEQMESKARLIATAQKSSLSSFQIQRELAQSEAVRTPTLGLNPASSRAQASANQHAKRAWMVGLGVLGGIAVLLSGWLWWHGRSVHPQLVATPKPQLAPTPPPAIPSAVTKPVAEASAAPAPDEAPKPAEAVESRKSAPLKALAPKPTLGRLTLQTSPWTVVYLENKRLGETPLIDHPMLVGTHRLKLVNEEFGGSTMVEINIKANRTTVMKLKL